MNLSCLAFAMLSRVPVSNVVSSVIYGSFTVDALLSLHLLSFSLFSATGVCVYYYFYLITPASLDYFSQRLQPLLTSLSAWTDFLFTVLLSPAYSPSLLDAVLLVVPLHDLLTLLSTYPLRLR